MRAAYYERNGSADDVLIVGDLPDPVAGPGEVRVRMRWSGVNPSDVKTRSGLRGKMTFSRVVPHSDGMGVIESVGAGVDSGRIGQPVWTWNAAFGRASGTAAQYVVLPQDQAVSMPAAATDEAGACMGVPALTALHAVMAEGGVSGQRVLVAGGAGAVGHYAVQFARLLGASQIIATVSSDAKARLAREAGAHATVNYRDADAAKSILDATSGAGVDRVIELDIASNAALDLEVVKQDGLWVVYGSSTPDFKLPFFQMISKNVRVSFFMVYRLTAEDRQRATTQLTNWLQEGALIHNIAARYPLDRIAAAHKEVEQGKALGNVVLSIE
jgi:NADPH2:quinone reductase